MSAISLAILAYQAVIFLIVAGSGGNAVVTGLAVLWTLTHVFFLPLMLLQLMVVFVAWCYGRSHRGRS